MLKWTAIVVGCLVGLVLLMAAIGCCLPRGHRASVSIGVAEPPSAVWERVRGIERWASWNDAIETSERLDDVEGRERYRVKFGAGPMTSRVEESRPPDGSGAGRLVTRIDDPSLPYGGTWTWTVAAAPGDAGGSVVTIVEDGEVGHPVFRFLSRFVFGHYGSMETMLAALGRSSGVRSAAERIE